MQIPGTVSDILQNKGALIWSISPDTRVYDAIKLMADKNIGLVMVTDGPKLVGVISERDYTRKVVLKGRSSKETAVSEIMTDNLLTAHPNDSVEDCLQRMTKNRVRHLPVLQNGALMGVVSIGDLVKWVISAQHSTISQLESYITGNFA